MNELPSDIVFYIVDYLDVNTIWRELSLVNKRLYNLINHTNYWKQRLRKNGAVLPIRHFSMGPGRFVKFANNYEQELNIINKLKKPSIVQAHYGTADAVRLISSGIQCVTGARNSSLSFWDLIDVRGTKKPKKLQEIKQAHLGWIWSVEDGIGSVLSSGFDNFLKQWQLTNSDWKLSNEVCLGAPVLWSRSTDEMIFVGTCNSKISVLDRRNWSETICTLTYHKQPVINAIVEKDSPYFYTLCEEGISCGDNRMWSKLKEFRWRNPCHSIAKCHDFLYVARSSENRQNTLITCIDTKTLTSLNELKINGSSKCRLSSTKTTIACLGNELTLFSGGIRPKSLWKFENISNAINMDYKNGRIVITCSNGKLLYFSG